MFKNLKFSKNYIILFFIISGLCFFFCNYNGEVDIWFLLSHGRYIFDNGLPYTDILSMHTGFEFVMQQWLTSIIFYFIHNYFGKIGLYLFIFLLNCVVTFLTYKLCLIISKNKKFASCFISVILTILLQIGHIVPRPHIFTFIILLVVLIMLELFSSKRKKYINYLPLLSILLINFHASMWPMIFIFCMPYVAELILKKDKDVYHLIIMMIISCLAGFINPYGLGAMTYSLKCYGHKFICAIVGEMSAFNLLAGLFVKLWSFLILVVFLVSNLIILFNSNKKNFRIAHLLLFYGTFFMSLISIRNFSLFAIGTIPFLVKYLNIKDKDEFVLNKKWIINYIVILCAFIGAFASSIINKHYEFSLVSKDVVSYLDKHADKDIKLYCDYSDGAFYEYNGYKPYLDSRAEIFIKSMNKKEDILKEYLEFNLKESTRDEFIKKYDFDYYSVDALNLEVVNYLLNYKDINFELVYANERIYLIKKVS